MERTFIVECYWPGLTQSACAEALTRARATARRLGADGRGIRVVDCLLLPTDEAVYYRFAGKSVEDVEQVCEHARLPFARVLEYIDLTGSGRTG